MALLFSLVILAATVYAVIDIAQREDDRIKLLPKVGWLVVVILIPLFGALLWFLLGRVWDRTPFEGRAPREPRPRWTPPPAPPAPPRDTRTTEQQLADLEREIEEERLRAEQRRRDAPGGGAPGGA
jgi:hypothetical protein